MVTNASQSFDVQVLSANLITIITNHGNGSKLIRFARQHGIKTATCVFGRGVHESQLLRFLELDDVRKEVIFLVSPKEKTNDFLAKLKDIFISDKINHNIAFVLNLSSVFGAYYKGIDAGLEEEVESDMKLFLTIVDHGQVEDVVEFMQEDGFSNGIIIEAHGSTEISNLVFNMPIQTEKEIMLQLIPTKDADAVSEMLTKKFELTKPKKGILIMLNVVQTLGLEAGD